MVWLNEKPVVEQEKGSLTLTKNISLTRSGGGFSMRASLAGTRELNRFLPELGFVGEMGTSFIDWLSSAYLFIGATSTPDSQKIFDSGLIAIGVKLGG